MIRATFQLEGRNYLFDAATPIDLAIPQRFGNDQPNAWDVALAEAVAARAGSMIGDTRKGGSCNFQELRIIPHCNGTHTEGVGHIVDERTSICDLPIVNCAPAYLVSVRPTPAGKTVETYGPQRKSGDGLITRAALENVLADVAGSWLRALIVRTLPNDESKKNRRYREGTPYFSIEAMEYVVSRGVEHLLVDLPSVDRIHDGGELRIHRIFWGVPLGSQRVEAAQRPHATITEFIYVPESVADGRYVLSLQLPAFGSDAAPSRPTLFLIEEAGHGV